MLGTIYGDEYNNSPALKNIHAITFAGTVVGQLVFGYTSDKWSRKNSLLISTCILILFAALGAGSYGYHGSVQGMFAALTAYRFFVSQSRSLPSSQSQQVKSLELLITSSPTRKY